MHIQIIMSTDKTNKIEIAVWLLNQCMLLSLGKITPRGGHIMTSLIMVIRTVVELTLIKEIIKWGWEIKVLGGILST